MGSKSKRAIGNEAEDLACEYLQEQGWKIIERNYYAGHSEIDIIAEDSGTVVFIEVKMRSGIQFGSPIEHVTESKVEHVYRAAEVWVQKNEAFNFPLRFDVIGIIKQRNTQPKISHIQDAYR